MFYIAAIAGYVVSMYFVPFLVPVVFGLVAISGVARFIEKRFGHG